MNLESQIEQEFLAAVKAKDKVVVSTLRMLKAAIQNRKIEKMISKTEPLADSEMLLMLKSEVKKRQDSITAYQSGNRPDLVSAEENELVILKKFMPEQISETDLRQIVQDILKESGLSGPSNFGKIMGLVMAKTNGRADGQIVSKIVKEEVNK